MNQARGPKLLKGAFVAKVDLNPKPAFVVFQYNPASLQRSVTPQMVGGETNDRSLQVRFTGAPVETISLDIELDAIDGLAAADPIAVESGISPQLAALELMTFPKASEVTRREALLSAGTLTIAPMTAPSISLVWGPKRVIPVRINSLQITEEEFDQRLNPIRATVGVSMRVLTYSDLVPSASAYNEFLAYQRSLETLAAAVSTDGSRTGVNPSAI